MNIRISNELTLPLDIVTARIAIYGTSGSGKTAFGRLLAEGVHAANHRFCAIDLKNDWWGLKSSADGKLEGIPVVVFGGPKKDVALYPDAGAVVADTVCAIDQSCIVDLDEMSKGKQLVFLTHFLERLYDVNRAPLLLIADEADRYAPQRAMSVEANISLGAAEDICRRGRKRGIGSMWITQRTAVLNKNVADICDLTVVFRTPGSRDLKELEERVGRIADKKNTAEVMRLAPGLADGQAIFLSSHPKLSKFLPENARPIQLPLPVTYDSSATPGVGKRRAEPNVLAKTDLAQIEQKMAAQIERSKEEDPKALKRQVAELKRENVKLQQITAVSVQEVKEEFCVKESQLKRAEKLAEQMTAFARKMDDVYGDLCSAIQKVTVARKPPPVSIPHRGDADMQQNLHKWNAAPPVVTVQKVGANPVRRSDVKIGAGERRVLIAIAQHENGVTAEQLTVLTGYKRSSRNTYLQRLMSAGLAWRTGNRIIVTQAGVDELGEHYEPLPTGRALQDYWLRELSGGERAILEYVLLGHPAATDREAMGAALGYQRSSRNTYIQRLQARELVWSDREGLHAAKQFFS